jgi:hypothetical protein
MESEVGNPGQKWYEWIKAHAPHAHEPGYRKFAGLVHFIEYKLIKDILSRTADERANIVDSIGVVASFMTEHRGHDFIEIPVVRIPLAKELQFYLCSDLCEWFVSVHAEREIRADFMGTFDEQSVFMPPWYKLGGWTYSPYAKNQSQFTGVFPCSDRVSTFFWILTRQVLGYSSTGGFGFGPSD